MTQQGQVFRLKTRDRDGNPLCRRVPIRRRVERPPAPGTLDDTVGCAAGGIGLGGAAVVTVYRSATHLQMRLNPTAWPPNRADVQPLTMEVLYQLS
jgi:hypothetical protein